jgi:hypothetical protein
MIVYGDPRFQATARGLLAGLRQQFTLTRPDDLDGLRALMIQAGQFEQAVSDSDAGQDANGSARVLTNLAAAAFYAACTKCQIKLPPPISSVGKALAELEEALQSCCNSADTFLLAKIPEGFEFYALYPEQYCHSTLKWIAQNRGSGRNRNVLVIGIRSIGTTLSALVMVTLHAAGWQPKRITVRPTGSPFERTVELPHAALKDAQHALVVDEGPGLSGSSIAAVAHSWVSAGLKHEQVSFLPGHDRAPGQAASADIHRWWASTARYVAPLEELRWNNSSLTESLAAKSKELCRVTEPFLHTEDLSGGLWREKFYPNPVDYPPAATIFERLKFRCSTDSGISLLWKFTGLGAAGPNGEACAATAFTRLTERARGNWAPKPIGLFRGFVALPWITGTPLSKSDGDNPVVLNHIAHYLAAVSGPPLRAGEQSAALARTTDMLYWNTKETLGDAWAERALAASQAMRGLPPCPTAAGDGRLAPHEWLRTTDGSLLKLDGAGHELDHTIIGCQPLYWDLAGTIVEWKLSAASCSKLLAVLESCGIKLCLAALPFFRMAYAAFRMGQLSLCAGAVMGDKAEHPRLERAFAAYRADLAEQLQNLR